jgi:preprotein translocase subunit SecD
MRRNLAVRGVVFLGLVLAALVYLMPTALGDVPSWWSRLFSADKIHLGLDLRGGSHLVLEVKVEKAVENAMERMKGEMELLLRDKGLSAQLERAGGEIRLKTPAATAERIRDLIKGNLPSLAVAGSRAEQGVAELSLTLEERELRSVKEDAIDQSLQTIRNRIDQFGVSEPIIQRRGRQDILVQLPGIQDPERAKEIIGKTALLEFKLLNEGHNLEAALKTGPPPGTDVLYGRAQRGEGIVAGPDDKVAYLVESATLMTGESIVDARVRPGSGIEGPYVELVLNSTGARLFERITGENVRRRLAIILDNRVYSAPVIQERIGGGRASITGIFDLKEARDLAIVLRAGALPAPVEIIEERTVGPSLGSDSIRQGILSFVIGSSLVVLFMIAYYKGAGLVANLALIFNVLFLLAVLAGFQAVLTLPGIAGIVLTMGMAVDANVLINERIREEVRAGRSPRAAVEAGYERALPAILDSNVTTFLSGVILFQFGTGPIKGFAVTLCIGIITTVLTAVYMTRLYYDYRMVARRLNRISI